MPIPREEVDMMLSQGWEICATDDIEEYRPDRDQSIVPLAQQHRNLDEGENSQELEILFI